MIALVRAGRARLIGAIAAVTVVSLFLVAAPSPALARVMSVDEAANVASLVGAPAPSTTVQRALVPAWDSAVEDSAFPLTDRGRIPVAAADGSALVRITATAGTVPLTFFSDPHVAALYVPRGEIRSTTVLLPVIDGAVALWADTAPTAVRVEAVAHFGADVTSPGATLASPEPVLRADTATGLGGDRVDNDGVWLTLIGDGIDGEKTRGVHASFDLSLRNADTVTLSDGQEFPLPAGRTVVTTVVDPDEAGGTSISLRGSGNVATLRAHTRGSVVEAGEDAVAANLTGSYVRSTATKPSSVSLSATAQGASVAVADSGDVDHALVLLSAVNATQTSAIGSDVEGTGRTRGAAVDASGGTQPQLALVPVRPDGTATFIIYRGGVKLMVTPLGGYLGEPEAFNSENPAAIEITSPHDGDHVDISTSGYFFLEGTVTPGGNAIDRVEISSPAVGLIGTAAIDYTEDGVQWSMRTLAPADGEFEYIAEVFDRANPRTARAADSVRLTVDVPDADDTVTSPRAVVFDPDDTEFTVIDDTHISFAQWPDLGPGDIIVSGPAPGSESGFLGRFSSVNFEAGRWVVETTAASLTDIIHQADVEHHDDFDDGAGITVEDVLARDTLPDDALSGEVTVGTDETELSGATYEVLGADGVAAGDSAELRTGGDVDLTLSADDYDIDPADFELQCRAPGSDDMEPRGEDIDDNGEWKRKSTAAPAPSQCASPLLRANESAGVSGKFSIGAKASLLVGFENGKPRVMNGAGLKPLEFEAAQRRELTTRAAIGVTADGEAAVALRLVLDVKVKWRWKVIPTGVTVNAFELRLDTELRASAAIKLAFELQAKLNLKLTVAEVVLPTTMLFLGVIPVAIVNKLDVRVAIGGAIEGYVALPAVGVERKDVVGFRYTSATGMNRIKNDGGTTYVVPKFEEPREDMKIAVAGTIAVGPEVAYRSLIYSFAGPDVAITAKAGVGLSIQSAKTAGTYDVELEVFIAFGLAGDVELRLLRWSLLSVRLFNFEAKVTFFKKEYEWRP